MVENQTEPTRITDRDEIEAYLDAINHITLDEDEVLDVFQRPREEANFPRHLQIPVEEDAREGGWGVRAAMFEEPVFYGDPNILLERWWLTAGETETGDLSDDELRDLLVDEMEFEDATVGVKYDDLPDP